jgi:hypothetical protein
MSGFPISGLVFSTTAQAAAEMSMRMENLHAKARILGEPAQRVQEIVDDEYRRARTEPRPFNWDRVQDRVDNARPA